LPPPSPHLTFELFTRVVICLVPVARYVFFHDGMYTAR
jgi:hypothetical protein